MIWPRGIRLSVAGRHFVPDQKSNMPDGWMQASTAVIFDFYHAGSYLENRISDQVSNVCSGRKLLKQTSRLRETSRDYFLTNEETTAIHVTLDMNGQRISFEADTRRQSLLRVNCFANDLFSFTSRTEEIFRRQPNEKAAYKAETG